MAVDQGAAIRQATQPISELNIEITNARMGSFLRCGRSGGSELHMTILCEADFIEISCSQTKLAAIVTVAGIVDAKTAPALSDELDAQLAARTGALIVDLTSVDFLASAGLECLARAHALARNRTTVAVVADSRATSRPITLTGLDKMVTLFPTLDQALYALSA